MLDGYTGCVHKYHCKHKNVYFLMEFIYYVSFLQEYFRLWTLQTNLIWATWQDWMIAINGCTIIRNGSSSNNCYGLRFIFKDLKITWHLSKMFNIKVCSKRDWLFFKSNIIFITPGQHEELQIRAICHDLVNDAWRTKWLAISLVLKLFLYHSYTIKQNTK